MLPAGRTLRARRFAPVHLPQRNHRVFLFGYLHFVPVGSARFHRGARGPDQPGNGVSRPLGFMKLAAIQWERSGH